MIRLDCDAGMARAPIQETHERALPRLAHQRSRAARDDQIRPRQTYGHDVLRER